MTEVFSALGPDDPRGVAGYRLVARLGSGGMGKVYLSYTPAGRPVAIKVVRPELSEDTAFRRRFQQEVRAAERVRGLFTAPVIDYDTEAGTPWLATAYVAGPSLQDVVAGHGPLPVPTVLLLVAGIAEALQAVHQAGIVHRDLKPSNVLLAADGPRVIDFGISRALDGPALTNSGVAVGTPSFMSPEQAEGADVTPASDVFALGQIAAFASGGAATFGGGTPHGVLYRVVHKEPDLSHVPAALRELIGRCLNKAPSGRPGADQVIALCRAAAPGAELRRSDDWLPDAVAAEVGGRTAARSPGDDPRLNLTPVAPADPADPADPRAAHRTPGAEPSGTPAADPADADTAPLSRGRPTPAGPAALRAAARDDAIHDAPPAVADPASDGGSPGPAAESAAESAAGGGTAREASLPAAPEESVGWTPASASDRRPAVPAVERLGAFGPPAPDGPGDAPAVPARRRRPGTVVTGALLALAVLGGAAYYLSDRGEHGGQRAGADPSGPGASASHSTGDTPGGSGSADPTGSSPGTPRGRPPSGDVARPGAGGRGIDHPGVNLRAGYHLTLASAKLTPDDSDDTATDFGYARPPNGRAEVRAAGGSHLALLEDDEYGSRESCRGADRHTRAIARQRLTRGSRICVVAASGETGLVTYRGATPAHQPGDAITVDVTVWPAVTKPR